MSELQDGIVLAKVKTTELREQDINARVMDDDLFNQLVENIKKRGELEQLPYCALTSKGVEIVSGHHRVKAANVAGLEEIAVLLDTTNLSRSSIAAKQLAHNAIEGTDDPKVLKAIAALITDVDDMLEFAIDPKIFDDIEKNNVSLPSLDAKFEWNTVQFTFLDEQFEDLKKLCENVQPSDFMGVADKACFDEFAEALDRTKKFADTNNTSSTVWAMIKAANEKYGGSADTETKSLADIFGHGAISVETAEKVKKIIKKLEKSGEIDNPWDVFDVLAKRLCD